MEEKRSRKTCIVVSIIILITVSILVTLGMDYSNNQTTRRQTLRSLVTTNTTREPMVAQYCTNSYNAIEQAERNTNDMYNSSLKTYFKANATYLISNLVKGNFGNCLTELQINGIGTFVFISPFLIGLALLLLAWPFFLCCCWCQDTCPAQCCRSRNPTYSSCELNWVTVTVILSSILIAVTAIPALTNSGSFFGDFNCKSSKFFDNFLNGNETSNQLYFFSGVTSIRHQFVNVLSPVISNVNTQISKLSGSPGSALDTAKTNAASAKTSLQTMPNGNNNLQFGFNYNYPLESSSPTGTIASTIGSKIGVFGSPSTLLGDLYSYVNTLEANLTTITTAASGVSPHLTAGDIGARITAMDLILSQIESNLKLASSDKLSKLQQLLSKIDSYNIQYSFALYGSVLGIAMLALLGVIFVKCFNIITCRHCLYFVCLIAFFMAIILLLFAIILATGMSAGYYGCSYFSNVFTSPTIFTNMINDVLGPDYSNVSAYFAQCFGGTNDFLTYTDPTLSGYVNQLKTSVYNSHLYSFSDMTTNINTKLGAISTAIDNAGLGQLPDFDVTSTQGQSEIAFFNSVADKSLFSTSCPSASFSIFYQDVWVPGHSSTYQSYVGCQGKVTQDATTCSSGIASTATCPSSRCINSFSIISWYYRGSTIANMVPNANSRYGTCAPFNNFLTNFHNNYVKEVNDRIGNSAQDSANTAKLAGRYRANAKTPVEALATDMNTNVQSLFNNVYGNLTSTLGLDSVFNPESGVLKGLDCRLLSQSGVAMKDSLCVRSFNRIFLSLLLVGIMSFSMFLLVCCILCFNVRHYQSYIQQNGKSRPKVLPLDETESAIKILD